MRRPSFLLFFVVASFAAALPACGPCPASKVVPAEPEHTDIYTYTLAADGTVSESYGDPPGKSSPVIWCDGSCRNFFDDSKVSCQEACGNLTQSGEVQDCSFDSNRTSLRCAMYYPAQDERCNCDMYDC